MAIRSSDLHLSCVRVCDVYMSLLFALCWFQIHSRSAVTFKPPAGLSPRYFCGFTNNALFQLAAG